MRRPRPPDDRGPAPVTEFSRRASAAASDSAAWENKADDALAADDTLERPFFVAPSGGNITVGSVWFSPSAALTANNTNYATVTVSRRDGAGGGATVIASTDTRVAAGDLVAFVNRALALGATALTPGQILTIKIIKTAAGVVFPSGTLTVNYTTT